MSRGASVEHPWSIVGASLEHPGSMQGAYKGHLGGIEKERQPDAI